MSTTRFVMLISLALLLAGPAACRKKTEDPPRGHVADEATQGGEREAKDEPKEKSDRVELTEDALKELRLSFSRVEEHELAPALEVAAELVPDPDRHAGVGARVAGRVVEFRVKLGDQVERGAPLAALESPEVGKARAELVAATARAEVARAALARERALLDGRATSRKEVEEAEAAAKTAEADAAAARTLLATLGAAASDEAADPARVVVRSPLRGTVVARGAHIGQTVDPSTTLLEIVDLDRLLVEAQVYERELRLVAPGQPVQIEMRAYPGEVFTGKIERVGDTLDEKTRAAKIRMSIPNPGRRLKPGMFGTARIVGTRAKEGRRVLVVPWAAVQEVDGRPSVFVRAAPRSFELRRIHTGERAGDLVEILNGVRPGEEVVGEGSLLLKGELLRSTLGEAE